MAKTISRTGIVAGAAKSWKKIKAGEYENILTGWKVTKHRSGGAWPIRGAGGGVVETHNTMKFATIRADILAATTPKKKAPAKQMQSKPKPPKAKEAPTKKASTHRSIYDDWQPSW